MDYRVKAGTKDENISTDHHGPNAGHEAFEDGNDVAADRPAASKQNWAWRSDIGHYDWMDSYTSSFDYGSWNDTSFD